MSRVKKKTCLFVLPKKIKSTKNRAKHQSGSGSNLQRALCCDRIDTDERSMSSRPDKVVLVLFGVCLGAVGCYVLLNPLLITAGRNTARSVGTGAGVALFAAQARTKELEAALTLLEAGRPGGRGGSSTPTSIRSGKGGGRKEGEPRVVLAVVETRFCNPREKKPKWPRDYNAKYNMRRQGTAINLDYTRRHGYDFRMYCQGDAKGFANAWLKVSVLESLFDEAAKLDSPTYILLIDSDVYIRATAMKLPDWMKQNGIDFANVPWSLMYSKESVVPGKFKDPGWINTGAAYGYVDPSDKVRTAAALKMLRTWREASCTDCEDFQTEDKHPWEQGCMERLLKTSSIIQQQVNISHSHMNTWNGPWGAYLRHAWGGPGKDLRKWVFEDKALSLQLDVEKSVEMVLAQHLGPKSTFDPGCNARPADRKTNTN